MLNSKLGFMVYFLTCQSNTPTFYVFWLNFANTKEEFETFGQVFKGYQL
jgi:hypothetical protein